MARENKSQVTCNMEDLRNNALDSLTRMLKLMEKAGVDEECLSKIRNSVSSDPLNWPKTLRIVEGIIFSMPYVDHGMLSRLLLETWECVDGIFRHSRQTYFRKVRAVKSSKKKVDPKILEKLENECFLADHNQAMTTVNAIRMNHISQAFATNTPEAVAH